MESNNLAVVMSIMLLFENTSVRDRPNGSIWSNEDGVDAGMGHKHSRT